MSKLAADILPGGRLRARIAEPCLPAPAADLGVVAGDFRFELVTPGDESGPVRLFHREQSAGVFPTKQAAQGTIRLLTR